MGAGRYPQIASKASVFGIEMEYNDYCSFEPCLQNAVAKLKLIELRAKLHFIEFQESSRNYLTFTG